MKKKILKKIKLITRDMPIAKMVNDYPEVVNMLVTEWGFHCVSCYISNFEMFEDGARVHGIEGEDFEQMLNMCNEIAELKVKTNDK
ncbi:MAG: DUF1858 domain-containing protein [bacterium]